MKKLITLLFVLLITISVNATTYYISTAANGGSNSNNGSITSPWLTLSWACDHAMTSGDIIHVNAGIYTETSQCNLRVGVSIEGVGVTSHIISEVVVTRSGDISGGSINLTSASQGTNGNQHISGIKLDGNYYAGSTGSSSASGNVGILIKRRSNVVIHDCTIVGFYLCGIAVHGGDAYQPPATYATGNQIYNCIITDNGNEDTTWGGAGQIELGSQEGILIHDNTLSCMGRPDHNLINGNNISSIHYTKGIKVYNNYFYKREQESVWSFHIEMWNTEGGWEIYNNEFHGGDTGIDIAGDFNYKGAYPYCYYIHDNLFTGDYTESFQAKIAIDLENKQVEDIWIYRNRFTNKPSPFNVTNGNDAGVTIQRIYFAYNIMEGCGSDNPNDYRDVVQFRVVSDMVVQNFYYYNNLFLGGAAHLTGFKLDNQGLIHNFYFRNNIIANFTNATGGWMDVDNAGTIDGLYIDNNLFYNCVNGSDPIFSGNAVTNYVHSSNTVLGSLPFSSDYHLTSAHNGVYVAFPMAWSDYAGTTLGIPPEIGIYEFGTSIGIPTLSTTPVTSVTMSTANSGGVISSDGGATVTARGVCWSVNTSPTLVNSHTSNGTGTGSFSSSITGLSPGTPYYVRAYATNSIGTAFGNQVTFNTEINGAPVTTLIKQGNTMVKYGNSFLK